jgi:hypothetical protein
MSEELVILEDTPKSYDETSDDGHVTTHYQEREWPTSDQFPNKEFIG